MLHRKRNESHWQPPRCFEGEGFTEGRASRPRIEIQHTIPYQNSCSGAYSIPGCGAALMTRSPGPHLSHEFRIHSVQALSLASLGFFCGYVHPSYLDKMLLDQIRPHIEEPEKSAPSSDFGFGLVLTPLIVAVLQPLSYHHHPPSLIMTVNTERTPLLSSSSPPVDPRAVIPEDEEETAPGSRLDPSFLALATPSPAERRASLLKWLGIWAIVAGAIGWLTFEAMQKGDGEIDWMGALKKALGGVRSWDRATRSGKS